MAFPTKEELTSSSSSTHQWIYDIFLSFRGEDTRFGFTGHLYNALRDSGLNTFFDNNLKKGEEISKELLKTIEMSMISIVVLSENYASSTWCLDELVKILKCKNTKRIRMVYPIFYKVTPSEVRNNNGKFGIALDNHEKKFKDDMEKVKRWRKTLTEVANLSGHEYKNSCNEYEFDFIQRIIKEISSIKSNHMQLSVAKYQVGVDSRAQAIEFLLDMESNGVCMVGILGLGGVGKTTISIAVYNKIFDCFEASYFLEDVKEKSKTNVGITQLQETLLSKIFRGRNDRVNSVRKGITMIKESLRNKKVLLILDDVDQSKEIENLFGDCNWFASGSRVIITTRDKKVLEDLGQDHQISIYKVEELNSSEAHALFNMHAFQKTEPEQKYSNLAKEIISYANGLPLALEIMGSDLYGKSEDQWTCASEKYKKIPHGKIIDKLKISYDGLEKREMDTFLDIACFFKGFEKDEVVNILDACKLFPSLAVSRLIEKCLVTVDVWGKLRMHDLLQQMGREIVEQESEELENRSRIWCYEDAYKLLTENMGSNKIRGIMWHSPKPRTVNLKADTFKNMRNLKFLLVENIQISKGLKYFPNELRLLQWPKYDFLLPLKFYPQNLVVLNMPNSQIRLEKLLKQDRAFEKLKNINLSRCKFTTKLPYLLCAPNLKNLDLRGCENLIEVDESVGYLDKLETWNLDDCRNLEILPSLPKLKSLKHFGLRHCKRLEKFPAICAPNFEYLELIGCEKLIEVDESVGYLDKLETWNLHHCRNLEILPSLPKLMSLKRFSLRCCERLENFPAICAPNLELLDISSCEKLIEVDESVGYLDKLETWNLHHCRNLEILPSLPKLMSLKSFSLMFCERLENFPAICAPNLELLDISSCEKLIEVDESVGYLDKLETWYLHHCRNLEILPSLPKLMSLKSFSLMFCERLENFPAICAPNLELLDISSCEKLIEVHESVGYLDKLETWYLHHCRNLEILPSLPKLMSLKSFSLLFCERLENFPAICAPNLELLDISSCEKLIEVHESVGYLDKLEMWNLNDCRNLEILPSLPMLKSLKHIRLRHCKRLEKFPAICAPNLEFLDISSCEKLIEVHESVGYLDKLETWNLDCCRNLKILPSLPMLKSLRYFGLCHCERLEKFPAICAPNLVSLDISFCENLIEVHKSVGDLHKLRDWNLESCRKLEILPSRLLLRYLYHLNLNHCERLEKFPDIHPEMKYLRKLKLTNSGIREWPSSLTHLTKELMYLTLSNSKNLGNFLHSPNKLQLLEEIDISTANSFDCFSGYGFLSLTQLHLNHCDGDITELDFHYFPQLRYLHIYDCNIISIPQSISGLARLETIRIKYCKQLREIPTLPQSIRNVVVNKCPSLDLHSSSRLLIQFGEILGILPNRVHEGASSHISMDPFHEFEYNNRYSLKLPAAEIPECLKFNHQSFGNSVSFWVGEKFSKLAVCVAFRSVEAHTCQDWGVYICINGCNLYPIFNIDEGVSEELWLFSVSRGQLNERNLSEQNRIEVKVIYKIDIIKWIGVNVECTCYPQNSDVTCLPLPCAMNGCGSSSIPNDTELPPFLPVSSTSSASDSDHRVLNNGRNYILAGTGIQKRRRICL
ncbi:hypothetical protein SO802_025016 [Lithocarpus litseifolius]|uniref:TIR domain-containing protein n=1 Tax=Lithocarpus litseifolius TaxID=425828 RepID=A0AAW2BVK3_9ROSI